jgi:hypothetical protein
MSDFRWPKAAPSVLNVHKSPFLRYPQVCRSTVRALLLHSSSPILGTICLGASHNLRSVSFGNGRIRSAFRFLLPSDESKAYTCDAEEVMERKAS